MKARKESPLDLGTGNPWECSPPGAEQPVTGLCTGWELQSQPVDTEQRLIPLTEQKLYVINYDHIKVGEELRGVKARGSKAARKASRAPPRAAASSYERGRTRW